MISQEFIIAAADKSILKISGIHVRGLNTQDLERRLSERLLWVVSVLAAFGHNAGQLLVAVWVTGTPSILVYAPALVAASVITGAFTGVAAMYLVRALRKTGHFPQA